MSQKKTCRKISDFLELYPESVLVKWLESKEKAHLRQLSKLSGKDLERQANQKIKSYTLEQLAELKMKFVRPSV